VFAAWSFKVKAMVAGTLLSLQIKELNVSSKEGVVEVGPFASLPKEERIAAYLGSLLAKWIEGRWVIVVQPDQKALAVEKE
jgi:hypothetical protein